MINYEVNLEIESTIKESFLKWLPGHIQEILLLKGFKKAAIFYDTSSDKYYKITIIYQLDSLENLQYYFDHHATSLREKTKKIFSDQFKASRRVLKLIQLIEK